MKKKSLISRKVLQTELSVAIKAIGYMDFGTARFLIESILKRVQEYDLVPQKKEVGK